MKEFYSIEDVATMTMLSTRTIRNYLKQGFLEGDKVDGVWQFSPERLDSFMKNDFIRQSINTKRNGLVYDFMLNNTKVKDSVCSIYDYPVKDAKEAKDICTKIMTKINSNEYGEIKFSYNYDKKMVRIILIGEPQLITDLMKN